MKNKLIMKIGVFLQYFINAASHIDITRLEFDYVKYLGIWYVNFLFRLIVGKKPFKSGTQSRSIKL